MKTIKLSIILSLFLCLSTFVFSQQKIKTITLEDLIVKGTFRQKSVDGLRSMNDGMHYTTLENKGTRIVKYRYSTGKAVDTLVDVSHLNSNKLKRIQEYEFSPDESKILLVTDKEAIYRYSFSANYFIYNRKTKALILLSENGKQRLATFSPKGDRIAFVRDNNIFISNLRFNTEVQVTNDGKWNHIRNGAPDWVYEEEFEFTRAYEWSPDGTSLAYMKFDESNVPVFNITKFQGMYPELKENALYPENYTYKYPKAGEANSVVSVHVYSVRDKITKTMDVGGVTDQYIPRIKWTHNPKMLSIFRLNRHQNKLEILLANAKTGKSRVMFKEENKYYIDETGFDNLTYLEDNQHFIFTSERNGYNHIYLFDMNGNMIRQITKGEWDVTDYLGYDKEKEVFFYQSAEPSPLERSVYAIKVDGTGKKKLTSGVGTNNAVFSKGFQYFINNFSSITQPKTVTLHNAKGKLIRVLEDNKELVEKMETYRFQPKEFITVPAADGKTQLHAWMIKPCNFDPEKKYPALITQYSGPNTQKVTNSWSFDWYQYLAQEGYIVISVDPRGTGGRGEWFRKCTYMQLGKLESDDQVSAARYLAKQPFIDGNRIAIWGWSFGGFVSTLCLQKGSDVFKAAIAVAPVTSWRYYDSIYTERFMRTPRENPSGYNHNAPINHVDKIRGALLLCHGTADDNVHVQNVYELAEKLVQADKQFDMQIYTNRNHGISGGKTRLHLYNRFMKFLNTNL